MSRTTGFYVALFATAALAVGWYAAHMTIASRDRKNTEKRLEALTEARGRFRSIAALLAVLTAVVLYVEAMKKFK